MMSQRRRGAQIQVALTAFFALFSIVGLALYGLPYYYDFMVKEFGWSRTQVTSGNALSKLLIGPLFGFIAGWIVDRFGPRRLMLAGILMAGIALIGLSVMSALWMFYFFYLFNALGYVCGGPLPNQVLLSRWFDRSRGKAMGFAYLGIGIGGAVVPLLSYWLTQNFSWHGALRVLGILIIAIAFPMALFVKESPESDSESPATDGKDQRSKVENEMSNVEGRMSNAGAGGFPVRGSRSEARNQLGDPDSKLNPRSTFELRNSKFETSKLAPMKEVFSSAPFYLLAIGSMASIGAIGGANQHLKLFLSLDQGYAQREIARILSLVLTASIIGRLLMGWLADRFPKKYVMLLIYSIVASSIPLLFLASSPNVMYLFALIFGIGLGGDYMIIPLMAAELFGIRILGRLMGVILTADGVAEALSPMLVGRIYDSTKSYSSAFMILVAMAAIGAVAVALLPKSSGSKSRH
ncbi:MAG TPA: MFS transporter [Acidobacteriota bacterium]|jgi:MFS family permease|nr:MFS transporter [Acidobacteriota bacterium]